jgi:hypothetical protein
MCNRKIEEINETLAEISKAVEEIEKQTGYKIDTSLPPIELSAEDLEKLK